MADRTRAIVGVDVSRAAAQGAGCRASRCEGGVALDGEVGVALDGEVGVALDGEAGDALDAEGVMEGEGGVALEGKGSIVQDGEGGRRELGRERLVIRASGDGGCR